MGQNYKNKNDRKIAYNIIRAQIASDGGKNINTVLTYNIKDRDKKAYDTGYACKDEHILKAFRDIVNSRGTSMFHFSVRNFYYADGAYYNSIVYFNFKLGCEKYQISFHSFDPEVAKYAKNCRQTRWGKKVSREAAQVLADWFDL